MLKQPLNAANIGPFPSRAPADEMELDFDEVILSTHVNDGNIGNQFRDENKGDIHAVNPRGPVKATKVVYPYSSFRS